MDRAIEHYELADSLEPQIPEFLGNLARARRSQDDHSDEVVYLLQEIVFHDTRLDWVEWARDELQLMIPMSQYALQLESDKPSENTAAGDKKPSDNREQPLLTPPE